MRPNFTFRKIFLLFSFLILNSSFLIGTVRYVSKTGLSIPPYITWETAADSIQECINICVFGDTIYVANGVYEEQVIMIPGLSLIGAGMDSCVISLQTTGIPAVQVVDSCILKGFKIIVPNTLNTWGIEASGNSGLITLNKIVNASLGIYVDDSDITVYKNILGNIKGRGIWVFNSNSVIRQNSIYTDPNSQSIPTGIRIEAFTYDYTPYIDSNYIVAGKGGISMVFGTKATISSNIIFVNDEFAYGIIGGNPDTCWIYNNLVISENTMPGNASKGISSFTDPAFVFNNFVMGNFSNGGIIPGNYNVVMNNNAINGPKGIIKTSGANLILQYNNSWNNTINYSGTTPPDSTNLSVDPMIVNDDTTQGESDFHLQMSSPLIDAGDPNILDVDSSRSDISLYGGPFGESYTYIDLPPRPPVNLTAEYDTLNNLVILSWNRNSEADTAYYNVYRDTIVNFTIDTTKLISSQTDTFYTDAVPLGAKKLVYKITAVDSQGNESQPSEEVVIDFVSGINDPPVVINNYILYQNYPNPFNPSTKIGYKLKERGYVKLYVYDIKGELVSVLVNQSQEAGYYEVNFDASVGSGQSAVGNQLASGVYIYQIMVRNEKDLPIFTDIKKMIYLK